MTLLHPNRWGELTNNHRQALEILVSFEHAEIEPTAPASMRTAMHDLWQFGFATRIFGPPMRYKVTFLGRRAFASVGGKRDSA